MATGTEEWPQRQGYDPADPIGFPVVPSGRTFDDAGRELDAHELINSQALVARLQRHALGQEPTMTQSEIVAARTLVERVMVRAEALPKPETPALERTEIASNISDDEALKAYLAMLGQ